MITVTNVRKIKPQQSHFYGRFVQHVGIVNKLGQASFTLPANNARQSETLDFHISSVINYLNAKPNKVYDYKRGSLIHVQNKAEVFEVTVAIDVNCINKYPEVPCNEKVLICHAFIGHISEQNSTYQVLSDELLETALRHNESERTHRYAVVKVKRLQQQIVNGVKYILLVEVVPTISQKDADIFAPYPSNTNENPFTCEITFIEHPWINKKKSTLSATIVRVLKNFHLLVIGDLEIMEMMRKAKYPKLQASLIMQHCNNKDNLEPSNSSSSSSSSSSNNNDEVKARSTGQMEKISHEEKGLVRDLASLAAATLDSIDDDHHKRIVSAKRQGLTFTIIADIRMPGPSQIPKRSITTRAVKKETFADTQSTK
ncbi:hypothetical protein GWI33_022740 [Rhynchophorus ferrugineus]|uniref:Cystatin domain-containing protein n=1 Tax=Rhynchophorus ferrugineus TaxID=354439 RepID=A0A834IQ80_RHYFE|nr:hypothetical protein GWI33_022740 [Rhynchophorus ferrugineus]